MKEMWQKTKGRWKNLQISFLLLAVGVFCILIAYLYYATIKEGNAFLQAIDRDGARTLILLLAGIVGWYFLIARTEAAKQSAEAADQNARVAEQGLTTERLTRAIELLGEEKTSMRMGGIFGLEQIAESHEEDSRKIARILSAYVRELAPRIEKKEDRSNPPPDMHSMVQDLHRRIKEYNDESEELLRKRRDIEAAVEVLSRIASKLTYEDQYNKQKRYLCDLRNTELRDFRFIGMDLSEFDITNSNLTSAWLNNVNFARAILQHADFKWAHLDEACLIDARLDRVCLESTTLKKANLSGARLDYGSLRGAHFEYANLRCAYLQSASLIGAQFCGAELSGAYFVNSDLSGARLTDANLSGAKFQGAKNMKQKQFDGAYYWKGFPPDMPEIPPDRSETWKLPPVREPSEEQKQELLKAIKRRDSRIIDEKENPLHPQDF